MIVVSNTSPLIALAKIEHLFILSELFKQVLIPPLVVDEFQVNCTAREQSLVPVSTRALLQTAVRLGVIKDFNELETRLRGQDFFLPNY